MGRETDIFGDLSLDLVSEGFEFEDETPGGSGEESPESPDKGTERKGPVIQLDDLLEIDEIEATDEEEEEPAPEKTTKRSAPPSDPKPADDASPPSQIYAAFAKRLAEDGVLAEFDEQEFDRMVEETGSASAALVEFARASVSAAIEEYKESAQAEFKAFLDARDNNLPVDDYTKAFNVVKKLEGMSVDKFDDDSESADYVIRELLSAKGFKPAKIDKLLEQYEALGTKADEAAEAHQELLEMKRGEMAGLKTKAEQEKVQAAERAKAQRTQIKEFVDSTEELIPGVKLTKKEKEGLFKSITEPAGHYDNGVPYNAVMAQRAKNPLAFERMMHYLLQIGVFNLDEKNNPRPDWSKVTKVRQTQVADQFEQLMASSTGVVGSGKPAKPRSGPELDLGL